MVNAFYYPRSLNDALEQLSKNEILLIAGGTDLVVKNSHWIGHMDFSKTLMPLSHLPALRGISTGDTSVTIFAATSLNTILGHPSVPDPIKQAIRSIGSESIRNLGTLGGNICNASPAGDSLPALLGYDAVLTLQSVQGKRMVKLVDFIHAPGKTRIRPDELLLSVTIPKLSYDRYRFSKIGQRKGCAISKLSVFGIGRIENGHISDIRLSYGALGPVPIRITDSECFMNRKSASEVLDNWDIIENSLETQLKPIDDLRSDAAYRLEVALNLTKEFIASFTHC